MKKKIVLRGIWGVPIGIAIGYLITIFISLGLADGSYSPCVPELISAMGNEINAVVFQAFLCGVMGAGFAASSVIWERENWSIIKQTGIYFIIISVIMLPIAYFAYWMEHSAVGLLSYFGIFVLIFAFVWIIQFVIGKHNVRKMNENLHHVKGSMRNMFKKAFWVPYDESDAYPTVAKAHQAISKYCEENGYSYSFHGDDEAVIDNKLYEIYRGYETGSRGNYGIKCREK